MSTCSYGQVLTFFDLLSLNNFDLLDVSVSHVVWRILYRSRSSTTWETVGYTAVVHSSPGSALVQQDEYFVEGVALHVEEHRSRISLSM